MSNHLTTSVKTHLATLWDKTEVKVTEAFFRSWQNSAIPGDTILAVDKNFSCRKSTVAKITKLKPDHYCPAGQRLSEERRRYYEEEPRKKPITPEERAKKMAIARLIRQKNPDLFPKK